MKLSIVVPVYNEEKNLPELFVQIVAAMQPLEMDWDVTFVDDGSHDARVAPEGEPWVTSNDCPCW